MKTTAVQYMLIVSMTSQAKLSASAIGFMAALDDT